MSVLGNLLDETVKVGANKVCYVNFEFSNLDKLLTDARKKAAQNAREKADLYAVELGRAVGYAETISEASTSRFRVESMARSSADVAFSPGEKDVVVTLNVVFNFK